MSDHEEKEDRLDPEQVEEVLTTNDDTCMDQDEGLATSTVGTTDQPSIVYLSQGRRLDRFCDRPTKKGDPSVHEWIRDMKSHIQLRKLDPLSQSSLILNHLGGKARREIVGRGKDLQKQPKGIFEVLIRVFGDGDTLTQLQQRFYQYRQGENEDLVSCSLELVELYDRICDLDGSFKSNRERSLKGRLAEAVKDEALRRELRRLNLENPGMTFFDARDQITQWVGKSKPLSRGNVTVEKVSADSEYHHLIMKQGEQIKEQQKQIEELIQAMKEVTPQERKTNNSQERYVGYRGNSSGGPRRCFNCGSKFHIVKDCPDKPLNTQSAGQPPSSTPESPLN